MLSECQDAVCLAAVVDCSLESLFVCFVSSLDSAPLHNLSSVCGVDFSTRLRHCICADLASKFMHYSYVLDILSQSGPEAGAVFARQATR